MMHDKPDASVEGLSGVYQLLVNTIGAKQTQHIEIEQVNKRCLQNVSTQLEESFAGVTSQITDGLSKTKHIAREVENLPQVMDKERQDLPQRLKFPLLQNIRQRVMTLIAHLHAATEDPVQLYPRLLCGSIPLDPAKITKFSKQHRVLQQLNDMDETISLNDRSLSAPPKSSAEVISKVVSSAQRLSDAVLESVNQLAALENDFEELKQLGATLSQVKEPIADLLNQEEEMYGIVCRLRRMFSPESDSSESASDQEGEAEFGAGIVDTVRCSSKLLDNAAQSRSVVEGSVSKIRSLTGLFAQQMDSFEQRLEQTCGLLRRLAGVLKQFVANLPRLAREIRQFFVPTGWRALVMRPSDDLMSLLAGIDELRETLPDASALQDAASNATAHSKVIEQMTRMKEHMEELMVIPCKLIDQVQNQQFEAKIVGSVRHTLVSIVDELAVSAGEHVTGGVGNVLGQMVNGVGNLFPQNKSSSYGSPGANREQKGVFGSLVDEVRGGLLKAIF